MLFAFKNRSQAWNQWENNEKSKTDDSDTFQATSFETPRKQYVTQEWRQLCISGRKPENQ